jgi:hypothetical protein
LGFFVVSLGLMTINAIYLYWTQNRYSCGLHLKEKTKFEKGKSLNCMWANSKPSQHRGSPHDYADIMVPVLARMYKKRLAGYSALGYRVAEIVRN